MKKFKPTPEQKAYIKSLDCECKKKDAKKRFKIENELKPILYGEDKDLSVFTLKQLKKTLKIFREQNFKINQIEVKSEEVVKEEKKYVWLCINTAGGIYMIVGCFNSNIKAHKYIKGTVNHIVQKFEIK